MNKLHEHRQAEKQKQYLDRTNITFSQMFQNDQVCFQGVHIRFLRYGVYYQKASLAATAVIKFIHRIQWALGPISLLAQTASNVPSYSLQRMHPDFPHTSQHMACMTKTSMSDSAMHLEQDVSQADRHGFAAYVRSDTLQDIRSGEDTVSRVCAT